MVLTEEQKENRAQVLNDMVKAYIISNPRASIEEAISEVCEMLEKDPVKLRIINAISAMKQT